ncbi:hypothetical protein ACNSO7_25665 [Yersinia enterocolitica]
MPEMPPHKRNWRCPECGVEHEVWGATEQ